MNNSLKVETRASKFFDSFYQSQGYSIERFNWNQQDGCKREEYRVLQRKDIDLRIWNDKSSFLVSEKSRTKNYGDLLFELTNGTSMGSSLISGADVYMYILGLDEPVKVIYTFRVDQIKKVLNEILNNPQFKSVYEKFKDTAYQKLTGIRARNKLIINGEFFPYTLVSSKSTRGGQTWTNYSICIDPKDLTYFFNIKLKFITIK